MIDPTPDVGPCPYGAPMGRRSWGAPALVPDERPLVFHLRRIALIDGDYDVGGAYWGGPGPLFWYGDDESEVSIFIRAGSRAAAKSEVLKNFPNATFK